MLCSWSSWQSKAKQGRDLAVKQVPEPEPWRLYARSGEEKAQQICVANLALSAATLGAAPLLRSPSLGQSMKAESRKYSFCIDCLVLASSERRR